jgi:hypothetical protein
MASRAFTTKLISTCSSRPASARTGGNVGSTEGEQLPRQCRGAAGGQDDLFGVTPLRTGGEAIPQKLGIATDDRQQVVEVVGDPAREQAEHRIEVEVCLLLRAAQLGEPFFQTIGPAADRRRLLRRPQREAVSSVGVDVHFMAAPVALSVVGRKT